MGKELKELATDIIEEAKKEEFDRLKNMELMKRLVDKLTS